LAQFIETFAAFKVVSPGKAGHRLDPGFNRAAIPVNDFAKLF
jgi:hypothetical protein